MTEEKKPSEDGFNSYRLTLNCLCDKLSVRINDSYCHLLKTRCQEYQSQGLSQFLFRRRPYIGLTRNVYGLKDLAGAIRSRGTLRTGTHPISMFSEHSLNTMSLGKHCPKNLNLKHI